MAATSPDVRARAGRAIAVSLGDVCQVIGAQGKFSGNPSVPQSQLMHAGQML
jgi:hypothetical protein